MKRLLCTLLVLSCMMLSVVASAAPAVTLNANGPDGDSYTQGIWLTDWIYC